MPFSLSALLFRLAASRDPTRGIVGALLLDLPRVRFIQIGSNDGRTGDPLWAFRRNRGWSGVLVEPVPHVFERLQENYGRWPDRFRLVNVAVASTSGLHPFHFVPGDAAARPGADQMGSLDVDLARELAGRIDLASAVISRSVRCVTFEELCRETHMDEIELLHVDAEGADAEILRQVDLQRLRPVVILYEHVHLSPAAREATIDILTGAGYALWALRFDTIAVRLDAIREMKSLSKACAAAGRPTRAPAA